MNYDMQCFLEEFDHAGNVNILTGAGVSTLSGIPDFRGKNGFYSGGDLWNGYRKEDLFDIAIITFTEVEKKVCNKKSVAYAFHALCYYDNVRCAHKAFAVAGA